MVKAIFAKVTATVNLYRRISELASSSEINLSEVLALLNCAGCVKMTLKRENDSVFLLVYQRGKPEPDYTIKVK
tara:strand:+ start:181 stop:402 length:222 start_codon:yes stop_codon:yes gene_type:complete